MLFKFGVVADVQYGHEEDAGRCRFRKSLEKLDDAVSTLNQQDLDFVVQLGDLINGGEKAFDELQPVWSKLQHKSYSVLGNHDLCVPDTLKSSMYLKLGMPYRYYSQVLKNWKLIFLDGNDMSFNAFPKGSEKYNATKVYFEQLESKSEWWNGAIGETQLQWLENELIASEKSQQRVLVFCHYPLFSEDKYLLWNSQDVLHIISRFSCVKAWLNGHYHEGGAVLENGKHYITLKGMVETDDNSFATIAVYDDKLEICGIGREESRLLEF
jgi:manganese-dependent ADP-ribose/CDP-alcohol diphosphatase